jgi:methylamine dehydrogenase accessory protein MauD
MPTGVWFYAYVGLWGLVLLDAALLFGLIRQVVRLHEHWVLNDPDWGLPVGSPAPALPAQDLFGHPVSLAGQRGKKTALLFLSRGCKACRDTMPLVPSMAKREGTELVLVVADGPARAAAFVAEFDRDEAFPGVPVLPDADGQIREQYKVGGVPYLVVVGSDGRIASKGSASTYSRLGAELGRSRAHKEGRGAATPA